MMCNKCKAKNIHPIQEKKEDYWLCSCGSYHKGFPYRCPIQEFGKDILKKIDEMRTK